MKWYVQAHNEANTMRWKEKWKKKGRKGDECLGVRMDMLSASWGGEEGRSLLNTDLRGAGEGPRWHLLFQANP
jgi:hypothetical protein